MSSGKTAVISLLDDDRRLNNLDSITARSNMPDSEDKAGAKKAAREALMVLGTKWEERLGKRPTTSS